MHLLFYWTYDNYIRDIEGGAGYHLNSTRAILHDVEPGDHVWALTRRPDGAYVISACLTVHAKTRNAPDYRYGTYRVWGHLERSTYFDLDAQSNLDAVIRSLSPRTRADALYQSFMGPASVRSITDADDRMLHEATRGIPPSEAATLLDEEVVETNAYAGKASALERLVAEKNYGLSSERRHTITREVPIRNRVLVDRLQTMYDGQCQICRWDPHDEYGQPLCEGHHIEWLSRGGDDALENLMLVCPNHHRAIHRCDAPLDWPTLTLDFGTRQESLALTRHLA